MSVSEKINELVVGSPEEWELRDGLLRCNYLDLGVSISSGKILSGTFEVSSNFEEQKVLLATVKTWIVNKLEGD